MHVVTKIEEYRKNRSKIYIDQEFAFVLYKGELRIHKLSEGKEISEETIREINEVVLPKRAKLRLMNLLGTKEYTRAQLVQKLKDGLYSEDIIEEALAYVEGYGYVDDLSYAKRYIAWKGASRSKRKIQLDLTTKGIGRETIEEAFFEFDDEELKKQECEAILKELRKRRYDIENSDFEARQKVTSFLCNKGYNFTFVKDILDGNYLT